MFSQLRRQFGTAGLIVSIVALVAALAGGAIAANGGSEQKASASAKAKQGPPGPRGPRGFRGKPGPVGPVGPVGAKGDTGAAGANGAPGANGKDGATGPAGPQGPIGNTGPQGPIGNTGPQGPIGNTGPQGPAGSPWTAGGTLPVGATETGVYSIAGFFKPGNEARAGLAFPIQLANPLPGSNVHIICKDGKEFDGVFECVPQASPAKCAGTAAKPTAASGHLCVYIGTTATAAEGWALPHPVSITNTNGTPGADVAGAVVTFLKGAEGSGKANGAWAVTG